MKTDISNAELLDALKNAFDFRTDLEVAGFLTANKETVSQIRRGILGLSIAQRLKIIDRLWSIGVRDLLAKMAPESLANQLITLSHEVASSSDTEGNMTDDIALIDLFKNYGCKGGPFATDKDMADVLGLNVTL